MTRRRTSHAKRRTTILVTCDSHRNASRAARFRLQDGTWTPWDPGGRPSHIYRPTPGTVQVQCWTGRCLQRLTMTDQEVQAALSYLHPYRVGTVTMNDLRGTLQAITPHPTRTGANT